MKKKYGTSLIIGNGFDLNLGMVTDYRSFFNKLNSDDFFAKHADNPLLQFIKAKGEKENWYDFEGIIQEYATRGEQQSKVLENDSRTFAKNKWSIRC